VGKLCEVNARKGALDMAASTDQQRQPGARFGDGEEPGRTATEAEGGEQTEQSLHESARTQSRAEGDPETVDASLRQKDTS
jgi:hypothetical protein